MGNYKLINHNTLRNDLAEELKDLPTFDAPVDDLVDIVETKIAEIIDHHAPEVLRIKDRSVEDCNGNGARLVQRMTKLTILHRPKKQV